MLIRVMIALRTLAPVVFVLASAATASAAPPSNDDFEHAAPLSDPPSAVAGTVTDATRQAGEPRHAQLETPQTVWYAYRPSASGPVALDTCDSTFDTVLAVYTGSSVDALRELTSNDDMCGLGSRVRFAATAGQTYWIAVALLSAPSGESSAPAPQRDFRLRINPAERPSNDAFGRATPMRLFRTLSGETWDATKELGEPRHAPSGKSVWFRYRARRTDRLTLETEGSRFDTVLAVYTGRRVNSLRRVGIDDDGGPNATSVLRFTARRGVTYHIALDGFGLGGPYSVSLRDDSVRGMGLTFAPEEGQTLQSAARDGLVGMVGCARDCRVKIDAVVSRATARTLGLPSRVLGTTGGRLTGGEPELAIVSLSREAKRALQRESSVTVTFRVQLVGTHSRDRTLTEQITLTRAASG
jgi:hypothetical protein